ncbi:MAG TPA: UDP-N-acetylglucosamine 1-carboxyvinyltransferase, partial [Actinobacteria bacterium]|nr:UDP-N-acetylglucosamine 1-carboxyvinyltransferase [Actinomycetes bacterium]HEX21225.1 UDP-N-acetylglucosamine 1-carboxyvinyltransferase [Actinomycetota bacterium]
KWETPYHLVNKMRASIIVLGPLLSRIGQAKVAMPGGCNIGSRKIDLHIRGLELMGAEIEVGNGFIEAKSAGLQGIVIHLDFPSVGATENLIMAATLAKGTTVIENAAREPEIVDLANFLNTMGANISGAGNYDIVVKGVKRLHGTDYVIMPDRIETGTFLVAGAITGGNLFLEGAKEDYLLMALRKLKDIGLEVDSFSDGIEIKSTGRLAAVKISTLPHPGFPTDLQAPFMALLSLAEGTSVITENVFESRFVCVGELCRFGSAIKTKAHYAIIDGPRRLKGAKVKAPDLRGGAALILAGLAASGVTEITDVYHIDRGYERLEEKLTGVGADIERLEIKSNNYPAMDRQVEADLYQVPGL